MNKNCGYIMYKTGLWEERPNGKKIDPTFGVKVIMDGEYIILIEEDDIENFYNVIKRKKNESINMVKP